MWSEATQLWEPRNADQIKCMIGPFLLRLIDAEINKAVKKKDKKVLCKLRASVTSDRHSRGVLEKVKVALYDTKFESLPPNPHALPIQGGMVVDLQSGEVRERRKEDGFRFECPVRLVADPTQIDSFRV